MEEDPLCPVLEEPVVSEEPGVVLVPLCDCELAVPGFWLLLSAGGLLVLEDGFAPEV